MQKDRWTKEYTQLKIVPSTNTDFPSRALVWFLENYHISGRALDIGSGLARNSIYLANNGFEVVATEIVPEALKAAQEKVKVEGLQDKIRFIEISAGEKLGLEDESFDLVIDMMVMHLLTLEERAVYFNEVQRLLKAGGYFLFYTISADSPAAKDLFAKSPGPEENSYIISQTGMIEKGFTKDELRAAFPKLEMISFERKVSQTTFGEEKYEREYLQVLMQKSI